MQHAALRRMQANERVNEAQRYRNDTIIRLINEGRHEQAIEAIDKALETYRDLPNIVDELREFRLTELARVPGTRVSAGRLALDMAADYYNKGDAGCAGTLMQHFEVALPENKNKELVMLALTLLQETPIPSNDADTDNQLTLRRNYFSFLAKAHQLLGQSKEAEQALRRAISCAETQLRERRKQGYHELHIANSADQLTRLKKRLTTYDK